MRLKPRKTPRVTTRLDSGAEFLDSKGRRIKQTYASRECNKRYARWVPGGDTQLHIEEYAQQVVDGVLDYDTAVRLVESLTDAVGRPAARKRDLLMVLSRLRDDDGS
jgi:hypothetical protein